MLIHDLTELFASEITPERRRYEANASIFRQGDRVKGIFAVVEGQVRLERFTSEGRTAVLHTAMPDESFAAAAVFAERYHCDATAAVPSEVMLFPKDAVLNALRECSDTSLKYVALLSDQVRTLRAMIELRSNLSARERIIQYLQLFADSATRTVSVRGTLKDLASELGLAPESLYRALKRLEDDGTIERDRSRGEIRLRSTRPRIR